MRHPPALALAALLAAPLAAVSAPAHAQADPAAAQVAALNDALLSTMKGARQLGAKGRYDRLAPVLDRVYDFGAMTRFAVGPGWAQIAPADQQALTAAFRRMSIATYASNFDGWSGQSFTLDPKVETRGAAKLVKTVLVNPGKTNETLTYRLQGGAGGWRIVDVYYRGGISELSKQRSDFASTLAQPGGAKALAAKLNGVADRLLRG